MDDLDRLAAPLRRAETAVALTGAGVSAPSGVPTFRDDDGVWTRFEEGQFTYDRFRRDSAGFWRDRLALRRELFGGEYAPNAAHEALAALCRTGHLDAIVTQNTDGLHGEATRDAGDDGSTTGNLDAAGGAPDILELHGNASRVVCDDCGDRRQADPVVERVASDEGPPRCDCGGIYKPDVVLFGEQLPARVIERARTLARESDAFLAVGSSLVVEPAASLARTAARTGATVAVVNLEATPYDSVADVVVRADVTAVLPRLERLVADG